MQRPIQKRVPASRMHDGSVKTQAPRIFSTVCHWRPERLAAIVDVLTSSTAVLELHDKAGIPIDVATDHVLWALDVLTRATKEQRP